MGYLATEYTAFEGILHWFVSFLFLRDIAVPPAGRKRRGRASPAPSDTR